jgi:hypothetical protein
MLFRVTGMFLISKSLGGGEFRPYRLTTGDPSARAAREMRPSAWRLLVAVGVVARETKSSPKVPERGLFVAGLCGLYAVG